MLIAGGICPFCSGKSWIQTPTEGPVGHRHTFCSEACIPRFIRRFWEERGITAVVEELENRGHQYIQLVSLSKVHQETE